MKYVLIIQNKSAIRDYMELVLGSNKSVTIALHANASDAINFLNLCPILDLMFIGDDIGIDIELKSFTDSIIEYAKKNEKVNIIGSNKGIQKLDITKFIHPQSPVEKILNILKETLAIEKDSFSFEHFQPIPLSLCLGIYKAPCDFHIKIGNGKNAKYIKRFKSNEDFDKDAVKTFIFKDMAKIYIHKDDIDTLNIYFRNKIKKESFFSTPRKDNDIVHVYSNSMRDSLDYVSFMLNNLNIKNSYSSLVTRIFDNMRDEVLMLPANNKKLINQFFINSLESENNFATKLVTLTSIISTNMVQSATWGNSEMVSKVIYASCFSDLALKGNREWISCLSEAELLNMTPNEVEQINNHAQDVVSKLRELYVLPIGTDKIILEHHGSRMGAGLPQEKENTSKLSTLFMVASEFSTKLLTKFENNMNDIDLHKFINKELPLVKKMDSEIFELLQGSI